MREHVEASLLDPPASPPDASAVTFEDVVRTPHWSSLNPGAFEFSPDDTAIANLVYDREDRSDSNLKLCVYDIATGAQKLACGAPGGFCRYEWARAGFGGEGGGSSGGARLMTHRGEADSCEVHVRDYADGEFGPARCVARRITPDGDPVLDPALSPDGRFVSFVRGSEVYVAPCDAPPSADGAGDGEPLWPLHPTRVTHGAHGRPMVTHGLAEYTAVEELGRDRGVWWRPDGGALAFTRADAGDVSLFEMRGPRSSAASLVEGALERHAYPFPGCRNARVTLGVVDVSGLADGTSSRGPSTRSPRSPAGESRDPERATRSPVARVGSRASNRRSFATSSPSDRFPTTWMDVDCGGGDASARGDAEEYLCAVRWTPDGKHLLAQIQNRSQDALRLVKLDAATGDRVGPDPLILERRGPAAPPSDAWVNQPPPGLPIVLRNGDLVWWSERSGFAHLYLIDGATGAVARAITSGRWCVDRVQGVDEGEDPSDPGWVYFVANVAGALETHLHRAPIRAGDETETDAPERLTTQPGTHSTVMDNAARRFVDVHSDINAPPRAVLYDVPRGRPPRARDAAEDAAPEEEAPRYQAKVLKQASAEPDADERRFVALLAPPSLVTMPSADGATTLHGAVYAPDPVRSGPPPYPLVVLCYGGPRAQTVANAWVMTVDARAQMYRRAGYLVLKLDPRGSGRRGLAFETAGCVGSDGGGLPRERAASEEERLLFRRRTLGLAAVEDQVAGVRWLQAQGLVEAGRASICGWSFGGFLAAMAVLRRPDAFRAAVAGAPVSRWEAYGCHYAERYLGDPIANRAGYEASALTPLVAEMRSDARLMIAHGMADENVHFRHSALLVDALRQAGKVAGRDYVLLPFPAERHNPKYLDDRAFLERRMFDFLEMNAGRRPPGGREAGAEGGREASEEEEADAEVRAPERGGESGAA